MQLEFVPVEEFYFALTLAVRTLEDLTKPGLAELVRERLQSKFGQPSTVAAASQNTFNYVFRVRGYDNSPASGLVVSIADWHGTLRLSSDYGWTLDASRKPVRTEKFQHRHEFAQHLRAYLQDLLQVPLLEEASGEVG
jgi:outer membrane protein assembly factor BamE (lipoprotein component of BamABCDE complex)